MFGGWVVFKFNNVIVKLQVLNELIRSIVFFLNFCNIIYINLSEKNIFDSYTFNQILYFQMDVISSLILKNMCFILLFLTYNLITKLVERHKTLYFKKYVIFCLFLVCDFITKKVSGKRRNNIFSKVRN